MLIHILLQHAIMPQNAIEFDANVIMHTNYINTVHSGTSGGAYTNILHTVHIIYTNMYVYMHVNTM